MRRLLLSSSAFALVIGLLATPTASAQQSLNLYIGGFTPMALDARGTDNRHDDVLFRDSLSLRTLNRDTGIDIGQFNNVTVGGEWLVGVGRNLEAGLGLGFYQRAVPTTYIALVNPDQTEIRQELKLRIVPFTATIRVLPFGNNAPIQPYIGAGVGVYAWRYSETGDFVGANNVTFTDSFVGSGTAVGPVILGGVRVPIGAVSIGGEIRWQAGLGTLPTSADFAGPKIDLGGVNYLLTFNVRF
jgi:hypothetical protein